MKIHYQIIGAVLAITSITAMAQETYLGTSTRNNIYQVGKKTTSFNNGPVVKTWIKFVSLTENRYHMYLIEVHCPTGMFRTLRNLTYANGYNVGVEDTPNIAWEDPIPGTVTEGYRDICR